MKKLLVVVDFQKDFVDGALGFAGAEKLEPLIAAEVDATLADGGYVFFTMDIHPDDYLDTREGRFLPIEHCILGSPGRELYGRFRPYRDNPPAHTTVVDKPGFGSCAVAKQVRELCGGDPDQIVVCGLVTDICVVSMAIILHSSFPFADVKVREDLVGTGNVEGGKAALLVLKGMGML